jgi:hypothetical protein
MHINTASVYWKRRKPMEDIRLSMKFIQVACNFVTESIKYLMFSFSFRTDFAADSAFGMLAGEVPRRKLIIVAAHIMYKRISGPQ